MIITEEDYLQHFGVKGMRWGVSRSNRALNKASRAKDRAKLDKDIDKARAAVKTPKRFRLTDKGSRSHTRYKQAKETYKRDRHVVGTREAKKTLKKAKAKRLNEVRTSQLAKSGKETTLAVAGAIGFMGASVLLSR